MKIYLLTVGNSKKGFFSLKRLCKETNGIDYDFIKNNLPFESGRFKIEIIEVDDKAF